MRFLCLPGAYGSSDVSSKRPGVTRRSPYLCYLSTPADTYKKFQVQLGKAPPVREPEASTSIMFTDMAKHQSSRN